MKTKKYTYNGYVLTMRDSGNTDRMGKVLVNYKLAAPDKTIVFSGADFAASPLHSPTGKESAGALLGFLTLQKEDTDSEYFDNYTARQIEFRDNDAEGLQIWGMKLSGEF